jgi:hypothetical protein
VIRLRSRKRRRRSADGQKLVEVGGSVVIGMRFGCGGSTADVPLFVGA